jgi:signal transduction histidine kinase
VLLARGSLPPPSIRSEAVVRVGPPTADWLETPVDVAVDLDELARRGMAVAREARIRRLALRPSTADATSDWLEAIRTLLGADLVRVVTPDDEVPALAPVARATRAGPVAVASAAELARRFGPTLTGVDAVRARALGPRPEDGVLILGVAADGPAWIARTDTFAAAVLEAAVLRNAAERVADAERRAEETASVMRRLFGVGGHDLSNLLFAALLGVATLKRQAPSPLVDRLGGSISGAVALLRRVLDTGAEVLGAPPAARGTADLESVFRRVRDQLVRDHPGRDIDGTVPILTVGVSDQVLERLLTTVLSNAVIHSEGPVSVRFATDQETVSVDVRNPGKLPFSDLERLAPFVHRSPRTLGAGLWSARRLIAGLPGVALEVREDGDVVDAVLRLPIASVADKPT